ncbi:hypothetical protein, partial [Bradyrhizobium liaoningense]|uniref:hypothetical protein n=1 Tax=Bradyrhizobium liaoningense TaxID=43992 RepID=UPI001BA7AAB8
IARICKVRRTYEKTTKSKRKFANYKYLRSVLRAHNYFEENGLLEHLAEIAPSVLMTQVRSGQHSIRTIIDASCDNVDQRKRSRWTRALQYAVNKDVSPADLLRFFRANNGIAGCADLASKIQIRSGLRPSKHGNQSTLISKRCTSLTRSLLR